MREERFKRTFIAFITSAIFQRDTKLCLFCLFIYFHAMQVITIFTFFSEPDYKTHLG